MANTIVTLNEVIKLMSNFVEGHPQLKDFGYGMTSEIGTSKQMTFPYLWATHDTDSNLAVSTNKTIIPQLSFTLLFVDQLNQQGNYEEINGENSDNGQEILSDCFQYGQDFIATAVSYWSQYGISLNEDVAAFPIQDETDDKVNGWGLRVTLNLKYYNCSGQIGAIIPITPPAGQTYITCETMGDCQTIIDIEDSIAALSGLTCETLSGCTYIQDIVSNISTNETNIATLSAATQTFYIGINFQTTDAFTYVAPEPFKINTVDNPDAISYTVTVNGGAYTLGNNIALYDEVVITPTSVGFLKLNSELI